MWRGQLDEPGTVTLTSITVNGRPAQMLADNWFEAVLSVQGGMNEVTVEATDGSDNVRTAVYEVDVVGQNATYSYDDNGNMEQKVEGGITWLYEWNSDDRLISVTKNGVDVVQFAYDPLGRRVEKVSAGVTSSYTYENEDVLREARGGTTYMYVHGPGIDEPLARHSAAATTYYHADGLRNIVATTGPAGAVTSTRRYDAWGNLQAGATEPGYAFTGREWEPETGLYYYRARYYDPVAGRFISEDPIGFIAGLNLYTYAYNSPTTFVDPSGQDVMSIGVSVSGAWILGGGFQANIVIAGGDHVTNGFIDVGLSGGVEMHAGLGATASGNIGYEWGNLGDNYESANVSTFIGSCSVYRSGRGSLADGVSVGVGPGVGVTVAEGEARTWLFSRDFLEPTARAIGEKIDLTIQRAKDFLWKRTGGDHRR